MSTRFDLGVVTAYAYAVEGGYTGTEAEFTALLGNIALDLEQIENLSVTVETLPAGSSATASYADGVLSLGIPKGDKGDKGNTGATGPTGATPDISIGTVTTGAVGSDAAATMTGTPEHPVLNLTLPRGATGDVTNLADTFSSSKAYTAGEYVIYNDLLYVFTANHAAGAWNASHVSQVKVGGELTGLKEDLSRMSNYTSEKMTEVDMIVNNGYLYNSTSGKSVYLKVESGKTYKIKLSGSFNRFVLVGCNSVANGSQATLIDSDAAGVYTEKEYVYNSDGTYAYILIGLTYNHSAYVLDSAVAYISATADEKKLYLFAQNVLNADVTDGIVSKSCNVTRYSTLLPDNNSKITSNANGCNFDVISISEVGQYTVKVTGMFNRFGIYVGNSVAIGTQLTLKSFESGTFTEKEYTYTSDGTIAYMMIVSNYPYSNSASVCSCEYSNIVDTSQIKVNGTKVYTKTGVDSLINTLDVDLGNVLSNYVSDNTVSVVTTVSAVYDLYDGLATNYDDYVTKTVLGQDAFGNNLLQYEFTSGNYNSDSSVQRNKDSAIVKPVVLIVTGIHGYERTSVMGTYQFMLDLCEGNDNLLDLRGNYTFKVIPLGVPSGFANNTRTNANGVNIDDNFDINWVKEYEGTDNFSGNSAADQLETQIIQTWINANTDAVLYIDHHNSGYVNEVSYLGGDNTATNMGEFKRSFLESMYKFMPYLELVEGFSSSLTYAYTGQFAQWSSSYNYASSKGLTGACLETSQNQNSSGLHSDLSIKTSAEVLGNVLKGYLESI